MNLRASNSPLSNLTRVMGLVASLFFVVSCADNSAEPVASKPNAQGPQNSTADRSATGDATVQTVERSNLSKEAVASRVNDFFSALIFSLQGERCYASRALARDLVGQDDLARGELRRLLTEAIHSVMQVERTTADVSIAIATEVNGNLENRSFESLRPVRLEGQSRSTLVFAQGIRARNWGPRRDLHYKYQLSLKVSPSQKFVDLRFDVSQASYDPSVESVTVRFEKSENVFNWSAVDLSYPESAKRLIERSCANRPLNTWFQR